MSQMQYYWIHAYHLNSWDMVFEIVGVPTVGSSTRARPVLGRILLFMLVILEHSPFNHLPWPHEKWIPRMQRDVQSMSHEEAEGVYPFPEY